ncbi:MAG: histidine phosphatase family protein [bacterium]|nr:histidine phosphatase family protein [bacterium]
MRYIVNTDGGSRGNPGPAGYGAVIADESGTVLLERAGFLGTATNNVAEYMAVVVALEEIAAADPGAQVTVQADSKLVVEQLSGTWKIKNAELQQLALRARRALPSSQVRYRWVPRAENAAADRLANLAMDDRRDLTRGQLGTVGGGGPAVVGPEEDAHVTLVFVRHGETEMTESGAHSGGTEPGPPLTARGREQARRAAELVGRMGELWEDLPAPAAVWTSPMVRARETAREVGERLGLEPVVVEELREGDFGRWQGLTGEEIEQDWPGELDRWHHEGVEAPGGESFPQVAERVRSIAGRALAAHAGETVVLVCHSVVTRTGIGTLAAMDPGTWYDLRVPAASVSVLRLRPGGHELVALGIPSELVESKDTPTLF